RAVFADLTVHFTDRFDVQIGGRESRNEQDYREYIVGPEFEAFGLPNPSIQPPVHTEDSSFTYLFTPRFRLSEALMIYSRLASGYRPGGPNATCILYDANCAYKPDRTKNYEIGAKGSLGEGIFSYDVSAYYIDWSDIQIQIFSPQNLGYF